MLKFVQDMGLLDIEYISLAQSISVDPAAPTMFDFVGNVQVSRGELLFNMLQWETSIADIDMSMKLPRASDRVHAWQWLYRNPSSRNTKSLFPAFPGFGIGMFAEGRFEVVVDPR